MTIERKLHIWLGICVFHWVMIVLIHRIFAEINELMIGWYLPLQWIDSQCLDLVLIYWNFIWFESILETSDSVQGQIICKLIGIFLDRTVKKKRKQMMYMMLNGKKIVEWNENLGVVNNKQKINKQTKLEF